MEKLDNLIVIIGPTAVGKSQLGIDIAKRHNGEIISGDSMQVYKNLDIGTAKVTVNEMDGIPHHMLDILEPDEDFSAAKFKSYAAPIIKDINSRNKLPIIVGGTGLYIQSLIDDYNFIDIEGSEKFREEKQLFVEQYGSELLYKELVQIDSNAAAKIHSNDVKRIIRALEVYHLTNKKISELSKKGESPYNLIYIGLEMNRKDLYERINLRVDSMVDKGLIEEVKYLSNLHLPKDSTAMQAIGYKELFPFIRNEMSLDECIEILKRNTRRFAKRQLTWFKRDPRICWYDVGNNNWSTLLQKIDNLIAGKFN
ncbi:tRNA (adenosine(37)-N6)-dimethylallyltransferase MiaA [Desulfuribacillus alkaliarsenatis]|uniref:tRNA dimethylallyltransferase n=1 Tax=Desulfuribacillus alkaliarsenatis TaxID=766136 RepID=A0A1E5FZK3_9FIRM|nr:tRNA (adenosine(37)-N6)-dimethylallyltransferase MiaA [Desulfuribacillus alkaliarsenatis]OEF96006.1 tRNA (adenosine(37)-N6)-dimethylallyltransferase MiaA [Desulfuribacillus alkaliarsenatis]